MSQLFLNREELTELTGFKAARFQVKWLQQNQWCFALNCHREPRIAREYFNLRMGCAGPAIKAATINQAATGTQPNFAALQQLATHGTPQNQKPRPAARNAHQG